MAKKACEKWRSPATYLIRGRTEADYANLSGDTSGLGAAIKDVEAASHMLPLHAGARVEWLASCLLAANTFRSNGDERAFEHYLKSAGVPAATIAQQDNPTTWELLYLAEYYYERGDHGDIEKAVACYQRAVTEHQDDVSFAFFSALLAELSSKTQPTQLIDLDALPENRPVTAAFEALLHLAAGDVNTAVEQAEDVVRKYDLSETDILGLSVLHMAGRTDEAEIVAKAEWTDSRDTWSDVRSGWRLRHVVAYFANVDSEASLLENAKNSDGGRLALVYAHWAIACRALGQRDPDKALEHFRQCAKQGTINQVYHQWARAMVKILETNSWPSSVEQGASP